MTRHFCPDQLHLSIDTVRTHVRQVYRKLDVHSQSGLLAKLLKLEQASSLWGTLSHAGIHPQGLELNK
jgi:hypothetical protein